MEIRHISINDIHPYPNNPRDNARAIDAVEASIREFGFLVPIVVDDRMNIVAGHTRVEAAKRIGMSEVPCVVADELTDEQLRAFRLADNKTQEAARWDYEKLAEELDGIGTIDMTAFGFDFMDTFDEPDGSTTSLDDYDEPRTSRLECPRCHHVDDKSHFKVVR